VRFATFTSIKPIEVKKIALILGFCACAGLMFAQEETADPKAKEILENLSKKTKTYKTIKAEFTIIIYDKDKKQSDKQTGSLMLRGGKYKLDVKGQLLLCDSTTIWTYLKDANEVQINNVDPSSDKGQISPTNIFTLYEKGFKSHFNSESKQGADDIESIDLYPKHPEREKYHTIKLGIDKQKNQIVNVKVLLKDGTMQEYIVNTFSPNVDMPLGDFKFNAKDYPGVEVEDLRN
jgi:outer membrane lipoprotein-sorting protein